MLDKQADARPDGRCDVRPSSSRIKITVDTYLLNVER